MVNVSRPLINHCKKPANGFDYIDPAQFYTDFAVDLPKEKAEFMANAQMPIADGVFHAVIMNPAWRLKPSWFMVASADRIINPDLQRIYAKRAKYKLFIMQQADVAMRVPLSDVHLIWVLRSNHSAGYARISDSTFLSIVKCQEIFHSDICTNK
jgi:hypothetical protein